MFDLTIVAAMIWFLIMPLWWFTREKMESKTKRISDILAVAMTALLFFI